MTAERTDITDKDREWENGMARLQMTFHGLSRMFSVFSGSNTEPGSDHIQPLGSGSDSSFIGQERVGHFVQGSLERTAEPRTWD